MKLYYSPGACSLAPHILLEECGADFEAIKVSIADGANRQSAYLAINARGRLPVLVVGKQVVSENLAIIYLISRKFPALKFLPEDDLLAARTFELLSFFASSVHVAFAQVWRSERFSDDESIHDAIREGGRRALLRFFDEIETLASAGAWLVGDQFTAADTYVFLFYRWARRLGIDTRAYGSWTQHSEQMLSRPAVERVLAREGLRASEFRPAD